MRRTFIVPHVRPDHFARLDTGIYVSVYRTMDHDGKTITGSTGYDQTRMAQYIDLLSTNPDISPAVPGLSPASSAEWGNSLRHFLANPNKTFCGMTGQNMAKEFVSEEMECTSSFLAFRDGKEFPDDVRQLLEERGFDGRTALIEFPYVHMDRDVFFAGPRTEVHDVSDTVATESGYILEYDDDLGIVTAVDTKPNPDYNGARYRVVPLETRQIRRGGGSSEHVERIFDVNAEDVPEFADCVIATRLSSEVDPSSYLDPEYVRTRAARKAAMHLVEDVGKEYSVSRETILDGLDEMPWD